mmetsp:Transcript_22315/g.66835  ORF Transcript_22315/g.66835 Transcript_22315/m.66835 type:complete len:505 (+) Transcript_22315:2-1516(+)
MVRVPAPAEGRRRRHAPDRGRRRGPLRAQGLRVRRAVGHDGGARAARGEGRRGRASSRRPRRRRGRGRVGARAAPDHDGVGGLCAVVARDARVGAPAAVDVRAPGRAVATGRAEPGARPEDVLAFTGRAAGGERARGRLRRRVIPRVLGRFSTIRELRRVGRVRRRARAIVREPREGRSHEAAPARAALAAAVGVERLARAQSASGRRRRAVARRVRVSGAPGVAAGRGAVPRHAVARARADAAVLRGAGDGACRGRRGRRGRRPREPEPRRGGAPVGARRRADGGPAVRRRGQFLGSARAGGLRGRATRGAPAARLQVRSLGGRGSCRAGSLAVRKQPRLALGVFFSQGGRRITAREPGDAGRRSLATDLRAARRRRVHPTLRHRVLRRARGPRRNDGRLPLGEPRQVATQKSRLGAGPRDVLRPRLRPVRRPAARGRDEPEGGVAQLRAIARGRVVVVLRAGRERPAQREHHAGPRGPVGAHRLRVYARQNAGRPQLRGRAL